MMVGGRTAFTIFAVVRTYCVYVMASGSRTFYTGVTNDLARRVNEHKRGLNAGFTQRYRVHRLV